MEQSQGVPVQKATDPMNDEKRPDNDSRMRRSSGPVAPAQPVKPPTRREQWDEFRPSKTLMFWSLLAVVALTMLVGFNWGGWMTTSSAQKMAVTASNTAVVARLAPICVAQFNLDPNKDEKLKELVAATSYDRSKYVSDQTWATMPGEEKATSQVAAACTTLIMKQAE